MIEIKGGSFDGHLIRRARKPYTCEAWLGSKHGKCRKSIPAGTYYAEGEPNDTAGGYGRARLCLDCAGPEARAAIPGVREAA